MPTKSANPDGLPTGLVVAGCSPFPRRGLLALLLPLCMGSVQGVKDWLKTHFKWRGTQTWEQSVSRFKTEKQRKQPANAF